MRCIVGDMVEFKCDIKDGYYDGEIMEVIDGDHLQEPTYLTKHLISDGNSYHIPAYNIVKRLGNHIFDNLVENMANL